MCAGRRAVPSGIDGGELRPAVHVGDLIAAQEFLAHRVEAAVSRVRVDTEVVAVPEINEHAGQRRAGAGGVPGDGEGEVEQRTRYDRSIGRIRSDVGAVQLLVDEVRSLSQRG